MSDVMLHGILNMPPECWNNDPLCQNQRYSAYKQASERIEYLEREISYLKEAIQGMKGDSEVDWGMIMDGHRGEL